MKRFVVWALVAMGWVPTVSAQINVLSTVKPIHLIVLELTDGAADAEYLLPAGTSPHDFAMRPSDLKRIRDADLFIWVGPELEQFLTRMAPRLSNAIALSEQERLSLRYYDGGYELDHGDHTHSHDGIDPHIWLGPEQASQIADIVFDQLIAKDPLHHQRYLDNLAAFKRNLNSTVTTLREEMLRVQDVGYFVFHDAYGYFESQFSLNNLGYFTVSPERRPGAKTLISIKQQLAENNARCVFKEPQFEPAVIESVVRGTGVKIGTLDPVASTVAAEKGGYFAFLEQLTAQYLQCLND